MVRNSVAIFENRKSQLTLLTTYLGFVQLYRVSDKQLLRLNGFKIFVILIVNLQLQLIKKFLLTITLNILSYSIDKYVICFNFQIMLFKYCKSSDKCKDSKRHPKRSDAGKAETTLQKQNEKEIREYRIEKDKYIM